MTPYQRRLFAFLGVATFFEGYDFMALSQVLPNIREDFGIGPAGGGWIVATAGVGTILAFVLIRRADRVGRRPMLNITILGYTLCTLLTALSQTAWDFAAFQFLARMFLIAEWSLAMVYAAEEFPAAKRGFVIGTLQGLVAVGAILCAGITPLLLATPLGWRAVYLAGVPPLLLLAWARRGLKETARFAATGSRTSVPLMTIMRGPWRVRVLQVAAIWGVTYLCTQTAVVFWKEFAVGDRGWSDGQVGGAMALASLISLPLVFMFGRFMDVLGRRRSAVLVYGMLALGTFLGYTLHSRLALTVALAIAVFAVSVQPAVVNAWTTELFPTELRADAFGWANNLLGRIGYVIAPLGVGYLAESVGWGNAVRGTAVFAVLALALILW
ncbi:MAG: MFS transporter, partial [Gemmatimonadales bacterium]